ncbi:uncharacterized protein NPIL_668821 [Nephila pilipes]|uniref:Uncharacterized protein n=1 Tax=Nephila pilipes TaxID=299642 RepID=A0A8X6TN70_NEPPI|nr:uncharacterized protein NPIL_668821 [Nephila pilipes]
MCLRCSRVIKRLNREINQCKPEHFVPSKQIDILKRKAMIDDVLEVVQRSFSTTSFFLITTNFVSCCRLFGWNLMYAWHSVKAIETFFYGVSSLGCLIGILWVAGGLPIEQQKLKKEFYKKSLLRLIFVGISQEPRLTKELLDSPDFVFSGCNILFYKRSSILVVIGTLLTYTILVVSIQ